MSKPAGKTKKIAVRQQFGVLPYRKTKIAGLEILLVTSRETRRWIIPKGWPIKALKPAEAAAQEAYEEAGLRGVTAPRAIGSYLYAKRLADKHTAIPCEVRVYPMRVRRQEAAWPEQAERETRWFSPESAMELVGEEGLKAIIADFAGLEAVAATWPVPKTKKK